jgi:hypothetical protein
MVAGVKHLAVHVALYARRERLGDRVGFVFSPR